ncbi:MAG: hypothetical protein A2X22_05210 [Bacteroidetes bacterium GWF2_49_14]|nr:MAG: hypothetical protein A2X22_05210 [Bacteroidetes bacterium GWF2_49_14]
MRRLAYIAFAGILILASCTKAELGPVISENPTAPTLTAPASGTNLVFTEATANDNVTFSWTAADFGFDAAVTYTVQYDKVGNDFKAPVTLKTTTELTASTKAEDLNSGFLGAEFPFGEVTGIEIRVMATISEIIPSIYSPVVNLGVNPYEVVVVYPQLQVPGSYQGWSPEDNNTVIFSKLSDKKYEGYIFFKDAGTFFKYTVGPSWSENYGDNGADGTLESGGADILAGDAGMYKLNVNLNNLTHSFTKTDWGLIGSATPGGWDNDTNMEYDAETRLLTLTVNLVAGDIKFRANDDWAINLGDNGNNGSCEYEGANIPIAAAGNYTLTLDLKGPIYRVKIKKN